ncbi:hypothetical protein TeGR_g8432 [Tetraparma gracilis]|uniref:Uncharacterized protein n=1 Tax=Tetraparma gracilis TaxID=2962635 RepID=A0ABQ6MGC1_9STRA|nr:hypothetical protein TeGR_g8432 [Tetraparma gracilis]
MGAGASALPDAVSKEALMGVAGEKFDSAKWEALNKDADGCCAKADLAAFFAPAEPDRKASIGGGTFIEVYSAVKARAVWQWDASMVADFFSPENMMDENGDEIKLEGEKPAEATGKQLLLGQAGLGEKDAEVVKAMLMHTAALFTGDLALMEDPHALPLGRGGGRQAARRHR